MRLLVSDARNERTCDTPLSHISTAQSSHGIIGKSWLEWTSYKTGSLGLTGRINRQLNLLRTEIAATTKGWTVAGKGAVLEDPMKGAQVVEPQSLHFQQSSNFNQQQAAKRKLPWLARNLVLFLSCSPGKPLQLGEDGIDIEASQTLEQDLHLVTAAKTFLFPFNCLESTS